MGSSKLYNMFWISCKYRIGRESNRRFLLLYALPVYVFEKSVLDDFIVTFVSKPFCAILYEQLRQ
jgi:hypothetical protein